MKQTFRKATIKDYPRIVELLKIPKSSKEWRINPRKYLKAYILNKYNFVFLLKQDSKIIGEIDGELWKDKRFAFIGNIFSKVKNKGVEDKLFFLFERYCKKNGIKSIVLFSKKEDFFAAKLNVRLGFKKAGVFNHFEKRI